MANSYEDDLVKEKARKEIYKFADSHLPRDRSNATALYLSSTNNRESSWLDKLGIPRQNRLILEGDPAKVEAVRQTNPGVAVLPMTTHEFFASEESRKYAPWWYCGLDYECQFNNDVQSELFTINNSHLIKDGGIIYTNTVGQREQENQKSSYLEDFCMQINSKVILADILGQEPNVIIDKYHEELSKVIKEWAPGNIKEPRKLTLEEQTYLNRVAAGRLLEYFPIKKLDELRGRTIQHMAHSLLGSSPSSSLFDFHFVPGAEEISRKGGIVCECYSTLVKNTGEFFRMRVPEILNYINQQQVKREKNATLVVDKNISKNAVEYFRKANLYLFAAAFSNRDATGYAVVDAKSFWYRSIKNTQMYLELMNVRQINPLVREMLNTMNDEGWIFYHEVATQRPFLTLETYETSRHTVPEMRANLKRDTHKLYNRLKKKIGFLLDFSEVVNRPYQRTYLGNSALPILTLSSARKCILEGMTDEQIEERYHVPNWGRVAAVRANVTRGNIKKEEPKIPRQVKKLEQELETQMGCKHLLSREIYRNLPVPLKMRLDYFLDEVVEPLRADKQNRVRQAFSESKIGDMIDNSIEPVRFYAFFDNVQLELLKGKKITSEFLNEAYLNVRDAKRLNEIVEYSRQKARVSKEEHEKPRKKEPLETIKEEVRALIASGIPRDEVWETYKQHFDSRLQFGAVTAWASPNLAKKRV